MTRNRRNRKESPPAGPPAAPPPIEKVGVLPGTDWLRSTTLFLLCAGYVFIFVQYCERSSGLRWTITAFIVTALLGYAGQVQAMLLAPEPLKDVSSLSTLFRPKYLATLASLFFLVVLCGWFVLTGGALRSPFAPVFTISPLYFLLQASSDADRKKFGALAERWARQRTTTVPDISKLWGGVRALQILGLVLSVATLTAGEAAVHWYRDTFASVLAAVLSCDLTGIMYVSFYVTVLLASVSAFPSEIRARALSRFVGVPGWARYLE